MNTVTKFIFLILLSPLLFGCVSAAVSGAGAIYDHNNLQNKIENQCIIWQATQEIHNDPAFTNPQFIKVSSFANTVLLTGQVPTEQEKSQAQNIVQNMSKVKHVINALEVMPPLTSSEQMTDTWITTKIRTQIIAAQGLDPSKVKVVTENHIVYLLGIATHEQADAIVDIAQNTAGVTKVVKIFTYIIIEDPIPPKPE